MSDQKQSNLNKPFAQQSQVNTTVNSSQSSFSHLQASQNHDFQQQQRKEMSELNKKNALLDQKVELLTIELNECSQRELYYKTNYDNIVATMHQENDQKLDYSALQIEITFLKEENTNLKQQVESSNAHFTQQLNFISSSKEITDTENQKIKKDLEDLQTQFQTTLINDNRLLQNLKNKNEQLEKEIKTLEKDYETKNSILEAELTKMKKKNQEELQKQKQESEKQLEEIKSIHQQEKKFQEDQINKHEEKIKKWGSENHNYLEMENKYLRDIKDLNDSFDEYKKQVEKHISQLSKEKQIYKRQSDENEAQLAKLKQTSRQITSCHEQTTKRLREKFLKIEQDFMIKQQELTKALQKIQSLKSQIVRLEGTEKKLRGLIVSKESFSTQQNQIISTISQQNSQNKKRNTQIENFEKRLKGISTLNRNYESIWGKKNKFSHLRSLTPSCTTPFLSQKSANNIFVSENERLNSQELNGTKARSISQNSALCFEKSYSILVSNSSHFICKFCQIKFSQIEFLSHLGSDYRCPSEKLFSKSKSEINGTSMKNDSKHRQSIIFKNSFIQHSEIQEINKLAKNLEIQNSRSSSLSNVPDEHLKESDSIQVKQDLMIEENLEIKSQLAYLKDQFQQMEREKAKNEKEMQNEIRFLLQQIIQKKNNDLKEELQDQKQISHRKSNSLGTLTGMKPMKKQKELSISKTQQSNTLSLESSESNESSNKVKTPIKEVQSRRGSIFEKRRNNIEGVNDQQDLSMLPKILYDKIIEDRKNAPFLNTENLDNQNECTLYSPQRTTDDMLQLKRIFTENGKDHPFVNPFCEEQVQVVERTANNNKVAQVKIKVNQSNYTPGMHSRLKNISINVQKPQTQKGNKNQKANVKGMKTNKSTGRLLRL